MFKLCSRVPIVVIADDLTGAAEIAGLAQRYGLSAKVLTEGGAPTSVTDVLVFDTDSRLDSPAIGAAKISRLVPTVLALRPALIYKKSDSVMRGPVRAELETLATALGLGRALLVPASPSLGRTVQVGRYLINGTALQQTAFGSDPHHPAATDDVCALLGTCGSFPVHVGVADRPLPATGIVVGDATSHADLDTWAATACDSSTLLAGASDFFGALLRQSSRTLAPVPPEVPRPPGPTLILSGTVHPARLAGPQRVARPAKHYVDHFAWAGEIRQCLVWHGVAIACFEGPISTDATLPFALRAALADVAYILNGDRSFAHLMVEGGTTAAAITRALDWSELTLEHAWAPGVSSLRPAAAAGLTLTLKPGSYPWPDALSNFLP